MTLSDIKLPTREDVTTLTATLGNTGEYLFDGWGSKFKTEALETEEPGEYYPSEGYIGFSSVKVNKKELNLQEIEVSIQDLVAGKVITPDEGYDGIGKITFKE